MNYISIDIGGSYIKNGVINDSGEILFSDKVKTPVDAEIDTLLNLLFECIDNALSKFDDVGGIGISVIGAINDDGAIIDAVTNIPSLLNCPIQKIVSERYKMPVIVENDAFSAALGELWKGVGCDIDTFFCVTIGTGMGGAFILNREVYKGKTGRACEIGYIRSTKSTQMYENTASMPSLLALAKSTVGEEIDGIAIFDRAKSGDPVYAEILDKWAYEVAGGIADIIAILDPGVIVVGGAVSEQGDFLLDLIKQRLHYFLPDGFIAEIHFLTAKCENNAGMLGVVYKLTELIKKEIKIL